MPFNNVAALEKSFPQVRSLSPTQKQKVLSVFNSILEGNPSADEGVAIAAAIAGAKKVDTTRPEKLDKHGDEELTHHIDEVELLSNGTSRIEILKVGKVQGRRLTVTLDMLKQFKVNFDARVYGTDIQVNLGHERGGEAAGWVKDLSIKGDSLFADVSWTPLGVEKVKSRQFRFTSSELSFSHPHHETGKLVKNVLIGVALTNIPAVKGMKAVSLSESVSIYFNNHNNMEKLKQLHTFLMANDSVTPAQFKSFSEEADEAAKDGSNEDSKAAEDMKKDVEEKVEEPAPAKKEGEGDGGGDGGKDGGGDGDGGDEALADKNTLIEKLSVKLQKNEKKLEQNAQQTQKLQDKIELSEICETVKKDFCLNEGEVSTGFTSDDETVGKVASFMLGLSQDDRKEFQAILNLHQTVDLSVRGADAKTGSVNGDLADKIEKANAEAKKLSVSSKRPYADCLAEVYDEHGLTK